MAIGRPPALFYYSAKARSRESSGERENRDNSWLGGKKDFNDAAGASLAGGFERNPLSFQGFSFSSILLRCYRSEKYFTSRLEKSSVWGSDEKSSDKRRHASASHWPDNLTTRLVSC